MPPCLCTSPDPPWSPYTQLPPIPDALAGSVNLSWKLSLVSSICLQLTKNSRWSELPSCENDPDDPN